MPLLLTALLLLASCGRQESTPQPAAPQAIPAVAPIDANSPTAELQNLFRAAGRPMTRNLAGSWVMTKSVTPGHSDTNGKGIRIGKSSADPHAWTLTFFPIAGDQLRMVSVEGDTAGAMSDLVFDQEGGLALKDYRCRASTATNLVCLRSGHEGEFGAEFTRVSH